MKILIWNLVWTMVVKVVDEDDVWLVSGECGRIVVLKLRKYRVKTVGGGLRRSSMVEGIMMW